MRLFYRLLLFLLIPVTVFGASRSWRGTGATYLWIEHDVARVAGTVLAGSGIELSPGVMTSPATSPAGALVWKVLRDVTDQAGRHVFYRQYLHLVSTGEDVELIGGEVGLHFDRAGTLTFLSGSQFSAVSFGNTVRLTRSDIPAVAQTALQHRPGFDADRSPSLSHGEARRRASDTQLTLVSDGQGRRFRFVYSTPVLDARNRPYRVDIDAENGAIATPPAAEFANANCLPSNTSIMYQATGTPVRPEPAPRSLSATPAASRPDSSFLYEGVLPSNSVTPEIRLYEAIDATNGPSPWACYSTVYSYTLFPLKTLVYNDLTPPWHGRMGGDALAATRLSMDALHALGYCGYDNTCSTASIVIGNPREIDNAGMFYTATTENPAYGLSIGMTPNWPYSPAASLDVIAHEWGHAVLFARHIYPDDTPDGGSIHEGFADFMGQHAEKVEQPSGFGVEQSSDWKVAEDSGNMGSSDYLRAADVDDGLSGHSYTGITVNNSLHKDDAAEDIHDIGNMMNVVYKLMTVGGTNVVCSRPGSTFSGCQNVSGIGLPKASAILFGAFTTLMTSTDAHWDQLANYAAQEAYTLYNTCTAATPDPATAEQLAVQGAFASIGYPRTTAFIYCPGGPPPPAPTGVTATASSSGSTVSISWTAVMGATSYEVLRSTTTLPGMNLGNYTVVGTPAASPFTDSTASPNTAYFYRVRTVVGSGSTAVKSDGSNYDLATTVGFTPLTSLSTAIFASHITGEYRPAVNAVRALAGLSAAVFSTDLAVDNPIKAVHISELRTALDQARTALQLPAVTYSESLTAGTTSIKTQQMDEIRGGVQ